MKKTYNEYIDIFKESEIPSFPFSNDEVRTIIKSGNQTLNKSSKRTTKMKGVIIMTIISSVVMTLLLSSLYLFDTGKKQEIQKPLTIDKSIASNDGAKSNEEIQQKIEKRNSSEEKNINERYKITDEITTEGVDFVKSHEKDEAQKPKFVENIAGIERLELTREELEKIGVKYESGIYTCIAEEIFDLPASIPDNLKDQLIKMGYDTTFRKGLIKNKVLIDTFSVTQKELQLTGWDSTKWSRVSPVAVTSVSNSYKYSPKYKIFNHNLSTVEYSFNGSPAFEKIDKTRSPVGMGDNNTYKPLMDRLLPVYIIIGDNKTLDSNKRRYAEVNIWFYTSEELVELLPDRYKNPIKKELELISNIENGNMGLDEACTALKGEKSYFDLCRMGTGTIKNVVIYPNPLENTQKINLRFTLTAKSNLKFELYDISGKFITEFLSNGSFNAGENSVPIPLKQQLSQGIFLLTISNDQGEKAVQKLIVK